MKRRLLVWPPKIGQRICLDTGFPQTSWSGEVRAVVDRDFAVVRRWRPHRGIHTYAVIERWMVEVYNAAGKEPAYFLGSLPKTTSHPNRERTKRS